VKEESDQARDALGRRAERPSEIPKRGWIATLKRVVQQFFEDQLPIVSAGIAFYFFLAIFPALAAFVSIYGLLLSPAEAVAQVEQLAVALPADVREMLGKVASGLAEESNQTLGWGTGLSVLLSLWSAKKGTNALFEGLNIAYNERNQRGFLKTNALTLLATAVLIIGGIVAIGLVALIPALLDFLQVPAGLDAVLSLVRWPVATLLIIAFLAWIYRIAPDREDARWRWISPGSVFATVGWLVGSLLFSWFIDSFGGFNKAFGTFAAVAILMLWFLLTAVVVLVGAELNAELEHQVVTDSTVPPNRPLGERGAWVADHVADPPDEESG